MKNDTTFYKQEDFDLLNKWSNQKYDRSNQKDIAIYNKLKEVYNKTKYFADKLNESLGGQFIVSVTRNPLKQSQHFDTYHWAKLYPTEEDKKEKYLAFTVGFESGGNIDCKIDTVSEGDGTGIRKKYIDIRGDFDNSDIVKRFPFKTLEEKNWDFLIGKCKEFIESNLDNYYSIKKELAQVKNGENKKTQKDKSRKDKDNDFPLNQILYGPPGTGKTYETITLALDILGVSYPKNDRKEVTRIYNEEVKKENISFTTFHQSMAYEDFIEGIKPVMSDPTNSDNNHDQLAYEVKPGKLMHMAATAAYENYVRDSDNVKELGFDYLYNQYIIDLQSRIDRNEPKGINTYTGFPIIIKGINSNDSILTKYKHSKSDYSSRPKRKEHLRKLYAEVKDISTIKNVGDLGPHIGTKGGMSSYWAVFNDFLKYSKSIDTSEVDKDEAGPDYHEIIQSFKAGMYNNKKYSKQSPRKVMIIDEINRGNISAIFGELITLLESDKRIGQTNQITTSLPYSPDAMFGLPPNLFIIGTMNTADRSVEALDTALRRRFTFVEKLPTPEVLMGEENKGQKIFHLYKLSDILNKINDRIESLIDKDHTIGHSYFFDLKDERALIRVFENKIIPLLQEYFYNDYLKIALVLGSGFIKITKNSDDKLFAKLDNVTNELEQVERSEYNFKVIKLSLGNFKAALKNLMS